LSLPDADVRIATLGTLVDAARDLPTPSLVVIGDVVAKAGGVNALVALAESA
jgi:siroheme synthase